MRISIILALSLLAPTALAAQADPAPATTHAQQANGYEQLTEALMPADLRAIAFEAVIRDTGKVMLNDPDFAYLEKECSGLTDAVMATMRAPLLEYDAVESKVLASEMMALFAENLTEQEAREFADFYKSPLGHKLMTVAAANLTFEQTIAGSVGEGEDAPIIVQQRDVQADSQRAIAGSIKSLSAEELQEIGTKFAQISGFSKMQKLQPRMAALKVDVANRNLIPGFDERFDAVIEEAMATHLEACGL